MLRVLVVDDSAVARLLLTHIYRDAGFEVVGEARDGEEAVALAAELEPDVISMDIRMPRMDGREATRTIMSQNPRPIVMVTSAEPVDVAHSFRAVEAGALALLEKPGGPGSPRYQELTHELVTTIRLRADVKLVRRHARAPRPPALPEAPPPPAGEIDLVAIGASTGGPGALAAILPALPADLPAPVLVVQHLATGFARGLAEWLDRLTPLRVRLAEHQAPLKAGEVLIAPDDRHLGVAAGRALLTTAPPVAGNRPSVSFLFSSVAQVYGPRALGVILTGMGADGASGLLELRRAGGMTFGQDRESSVVYGMPRAAASMGGVEHELALEAIGPAIERACRREPAPRRPAYRPRG